MLKGGSVGFHRRPPLRPSSGLLALAFALVAPAWVSASGASQEAPPPQASEPRLTLEKTRGWVGAFGGTSTADADGLEGGALFGGGGAFYFTRNFGIEVGVARHGRDAVGTPENALSGGSLDSTIVTGGVLVRFPVSPRVSPYLVGGVAYFSNSLEVDPAVAGELAALNFRLTEGLENKLGFQVGGGLDFLLASRFALFGEVRYLAASADTSTELADTVSGTAAQDGGSQDLNSFQIRAGVRVVF